MKILYNIGAQLCILGWILNCQAAIFVLHEEKMPDLGGGKEKKEPVIITGDNPGGVEPVLRVESILRDREKAAEKKVIENEALVAYRLGLKSNRHEAEHHFQRAAAIWRNFADVGDSNADFALAYLYLIGRGVPKDLNIAKAYLEKANEIIGSKYLYLKGLIEIASGNEQIGNRYILDAANAGDKFAQNELGIWYEVGKMGGALDSSLKWYTSAADKGLAPAALNLMCLQAIKGLRFRVQDVRMLAEQGEPHAMYDLGTFYHKGEGVGIDYSMAIRWYRRAALHGEPRAKYILGLIESKIKNPNYNNTTWMREILHYREVNQPSFLCRDKPLPRHADLISDDVIS